MYSALKRDGKRLYELARQGIEIEREPRRVVVRHISLTDWHPPVATVRIECGSGFYVRSLAHDLGETLGCGGHMRSLIRRRVGPFQIDDALTLEDALPRLSAASDGDDADSPLLPPDFVLGDMRPMTVHDRDARTIRHGGALPPGAGLPPEMPDERARVYDATGAFIAIAASTTPYANGARRRCLGRGEFDAEARSLSQFCLGARFSNIISSPAVISAKAEIQSPAPQPTPIFREPPSKLGQARRRAPCCNKCAIKCSIDRNAGVV